MNRRRNVIISLTAAVLSGCLVYGMYKLQRIQIEQQETVEVLVPKRFIGAGERLAESDLTYKRMPQAAFVPEMLVDSEQAAGKETIIPLGRGEPILNWKVDRYYLQPKRSESTFQIPKEYIRSISNGIRAGDKVLLYASGDASPSTRLFDEAVLVSSVKTSGNLEIDDVENPNLLSLAEGDKEQMYASRRDANGMIEYLNLNLTEAQWLRIDGLCKSGETKLVVAYSPESLDLPAPEEANAP
ncbi:SAF domain-containing protein [Paenibacillus arenilitoris]|uniref:SAF domain-containing protein n=1 Tax=Paenibacillus arenilitoris TaxID=2772299 RepID=A0A927CPX3_9BACL|nr:SAF domain-containing protein [Paenibacillus arenilitoris]MBD2870922.1 SAF domain-containing protein [Paenibacillus arenilitoris]